jgi:glycosyltransferase involved in cell wall biosynthesis
MNSPRVSVIVPLYNKRRFIRRALDSIAQQTFTEFEAIIVDDGSTDGSAQVALEFPDKRFRVIHQTNAGPGAARNRGIAEAQGEFVAFLDSDDRWLPAYLQKAVYALDFNPTLASISFCWQEEPNLRQMSELWAKHSANKSYRLDNRTSAANAVQLLAFMHPCTTVARTEIVRELGAFWGRSRCLYAEDAFLWLKVLLNHRVALNYEVMAIIDIAASELSHNRTGKRALEPFLEFPEQIRDFCPENLQPLLSNILAIRAFKTACVWAYSGHWRDSLTLCMRFWNIRSWALFPGTVLRALLGSRKRVSHDSGVLVKRVLSGN